MNAKWKSPVIAALALLGLAACGGGGGGGGGGGAPSSGSLDTSFGSGGKVTTTFLTDETTGDSRDQARAIALAPDGKIVVAGKSFNGRTFDFALARYY